MKAFPLLVPCLLPFTAAARDYERDIMPIFEKKCADCHSRASGESKGGLILDDPQHLLGRLEKNSLVVPGDWDASYLFITLYRPADDEDAMPPKGKGERLTPEEVTLVQKWITEGAPILGERGARGEMPEAAESMKKEKGALPEPSSPKSWTNREGKSIIATLLKVEGDVAVLRLANGTVHRYPIANLSDESRAALPK
jgi:mono/diheme cytochrome c family protein